MNDRIIALVACLALFVWLWSTEHENRAERHAKRAVTASILASRDAALPASTDSSIVDADVAEPCRAAETFSVLSIPLPQGIAPGRYLVLDCRGVSRNIEITPEQMSAADFQRAMPERDFYVKVLGGQHWIFENLRAIKRAASESTPTDEDIVAGDVESFPTGVCFEAMRAATRPQPAARQAMQWGPWLGELRSQAARIWTERRGGLLERAEQRRQRADSTTGHARRIANSIVAKIEMLGIRWMDRLVPAEAEDEIAFPQPGGRSL